MASSRLGKNLKPKQLTGYGSSSEDEVLDTVSGNGTAPSFGELLKAQRSLSKKRKRGSDANDDQDAKREALRERLKGLRSQHPEEKLPANQIERTSRNRTSENQNEDSDEDSDLAPSEEESTKPKSRTSKHAPMTMSSKHPVTRKRQVIAVPKNTSRDPRFDPLERPSPHLDKAYSFIWDYRKSEIAELKTAIKKARNEDDREKLLRKLASMENQLKAKEAKDREQEVLRRHRKEEREKAKAGKMPFFLKKKEVKERMETERFEGMKKKDQKKLIEKRRRREGQKEKKRMPEARRVVG